MSTPLQKDQAKELLKGLSTLEVRELCNKALWECHEAWPGNRQLSLHGHLGLKLVPLLAARKGVAYDERSGIREAFIDAAGDDGMEAFAEWVNWFVRVGFAWPLGALANQYPITLHLTEAGVRFLSGPDPDHPLLPDFVERMVKRCSGLPVDVQSLLIDARSCLDHGLTRPAIVLLGVAYEMAVEAIVESLVKKGALAAGTEDAKPWKRIDAVKGVVDTVLTKGSEEAHAAHAACGFAHDLRRRRNDASHTTPTYDFTDRAEVEEWLASAGRNLPPLWKMYSP